jgi:hypothetical protein
MSLRLDNNDVILCACFCVVAVVIMIVIFNIEVFFSIIRFLAYYWVITVPVIILAIITTRFVSIQRNMNKRFRSLNTIDNREEFQRTTGQKPFNEVGKFSKPYKKFMKSQILKPKGGYSIPVRLSDLKGFAIAILILIGTTWLTLYIYSQIFKDFRLNFWEAGFQG